jgi:hypothetical protein
MVPAMISFASNRCGRFIVDTPRCSPVGGNVWQVEQVDVVFRVESLGELVWDSAGRADDQQKWTFSGAMFPQPTPRLPVQLDGVVRIVGQRLDFLFNLGEPMFEQGLERLTSMFSSR